MRGPAAGRLLMLWAALGCSPPRTGAHEGGSLCSSDAHQILEARCDSCHATILVGAQRYGAPPDVNCDNDVELLKQVSRIREALSEKSMPPQGPLQDCESEKVLALLTELEKPPCTPMCLAKMCGNDGCGGSCGSCPKDQFCDAPSGNCTSACVPHCSGKECGPDGCDGVCGHCEDEDSCSNEGHCE